MEPSATDRMLDKLQKASFGFFLHEHNPENGLVRDKTGDDAPASVASVGLALACYTVAVERGFMRRTEALQRTLAVLRFFSDSPQHSGPDATGCHGFYYHFLDMKTGRRVWKCELSTIDTALLVAGMTAAAQYFDGDRAPEREVRERAEALFRRVDWRWATDGQNTLTHGWKPGGGFLKARWTGYNEGLLLYILALGAPEHSLAAKSYSAWTSSYAWRRTYDFEYLFAGPLFIHQLPHAWIDFRGFQDEYMRSKAIDYFENSRRATYAQQEYAIRNPRQFKLYSKVCWGITASDGPGPGTLTLHGRKRKFFGYQARGVPFGPDDGTIAPWAAVTSLPFAPDIVLPAIDYYNRLALGTNSRYGFEATFNPTYPGDNNSRAGWVSSRHYGLNQGPLVMMMENFRSGFVWRLLRECRWVRDGLRRAGFRGGWLPVKEA